MEKEEQNKEGSKGFWFLKEQQKEDEGRKRPRNGSWLSFLNLGKWKKEEDDVSLVIWK